MRQATLLLSMAAFVAAAPASQGIDFASVNAAPSPATTGPAASQSTHDVPYNSASVNAQGSAAATGVASASATASQVANSKRSFVWGWPWGSSPQKTTTQAAYPTTSTLSYSSSNTVSSIKATSVPTTTSIPTTTTSQGSSVTTTTSSDTSCPTQPKAGTKCGSISPEDQCAPQFDGYGPKITPDTVDAFWAYPEFQQQALAAQAPGYVATFRNLNATVNANTYLGLTTFKSYDAPLCAEYCNNKTLCTAFNLYVERDPSLNPSDNCTNPPSITNYKCTLWGSGVNTESAVNFGQYRSAFQVVVAGSDGFEKTNITTPATQPGWQPPKEAGGDGSKGHNHPSTSIGNHFFPGPYNPALCAAYANSQNAINAKSPFWYKWIMFWMGQYNPYKCNFFNSYMLKKNGRPLGTYCGLYSQSYDASYATYLPGWQGSDFWSIESSWSYDITN
ncbi:hypothetical protein VTL71DRAFT_4813 [Oculimacula yallundae]|uniref:Uncharacterized protein n=1 Tax=Oculimacula yallundae TaxID=86028 RepID=A0ABR4C328_9HELO